MAKKKLQDDVLFGEQDIITPETSASSASDSPSTESSVDDAALLLLQTQEKLLSNYDLMQQKMDASEKQIERLSQELKTFKDNQDVFVKVVQQDYTFRFDISPESLEKVHGVLQEETNDFKNETRKCTFAELTRLKKPMVTRRTTSMFSVSVGGLMATSSSSSLNCSSVATCCSS